MSIADLTDAALAEEAREGPPPGQSENPASADTLHRALGTISNYCLNLDRHGKPLLEQADDDLVEAIADLLAEGALSIGKIADDRKARAR